MEICILLFLSVHGVLRTSYWLTDLLIYLRTYLLTPWSRVLLGNLTGFQLVKKFPSFYWTRRFITAFTSARHLSLSRASSIHSIPPHPTSWKSILILSSHLRLGLPSGLLSLRFPHQYPAYTSPLPDTRYMPRPSNSSRFYHPNNNGWGVQVIQLWTSWCRYSSAPVFMLPALILTCLQELCYLLRFIGVFKRLHACYHNVILCRLTQ